MAWETFIGILAGTLTTISVLPQVIKSWKTKKTNDISTLMYVLLTTGIILWIIYGVLTNDLPITLANSVTLILVSSILFLKIKYG